MKKIIMGVLLSVLLFTSVNADIIIPGERRNNPIIREELIIESLTCNFDIKCFIDRKYNTNIPWIIFYFLFILLFYITLMIITILVSKLIKKKNGK